jgi:hypothetical protein
MLLFYAISGDKFNYAPGLRARDSIWPDTVLNLLLIHMWTHVNLYIHHPPIAAGNAVWCQGHAIKLSLDHDVALISYFKAARFLMLLKYS